MLRLLNEQGYIHLPKFITASQAVDYSNKLKQYTQNMAGDDQAPSSRACYNPPFLVELLCNKVVEVSSVLGAQVLPTYSYARVYLANSFLALHTDRPACEVSLTIHLDGDKQWPICFQKPNGMTRSLILDRGDAAIYSGCDIPHWRPIFNGTWYSQVFLHYVISMGQFHDHYFDKNSTVPVKVKKVKK